MSVESELIARMHTTPKARMDGLFVCVDDTVFIPFFDSGMNREDVLRAGVAILTTLPQILDGSISLSTGKFRVSHPLRVNKELRQYFEAIHESDPPPELIMDTYGIFLSRSSLLETHKTINSQTTLVWQRACPGFDVTTSS